MEVQVRDIFMGALITGVLGVTLSACDVASSVHERLPPEKQGIVNCESEKLNASISFNTESALIWTGTAGLSFEVTKLNSDQEVHLREEDGWVCTTPDGVTEPFFNRNP